ncbi:Na+/H+ antiporter NhaC [Corticicoccus populi]|uniref:Na+/H+ antiporter NhaC n=1 Tax=Corticicoccus populi TaxID=1812821 RepID=A0ABW5WXJ2_9STAP
MNKNIKTPSIGYSILVMAVVILVIMSGIVFFDASIEMMLLIALMITIPFILYLGHSYDHIQKAMFSMMSKALLPSMIVLVVGAMIGAWLISGTVPTLIYYGIQIVSPTYFFVTALLFCTIVSVSTGTSWGTMGTAGVALMGISHSLGLPAGMSAGAIISGAYFGDKISPLSDTTNLAAAVVGADVIDHVKHMLWTTIPAYILTFIVFFILGLNYGQGDASLTDINAMTNYLSESFNLGIITLIPVVIVISLLIFKKPPITSIFIGAAVGGVVAIFYQNVSLSEAIDVMYNGYVASSGIEVMDSLLSQGGVTSMFNLVALFLFALGLGGILNESGILNTFLKTFFSHVKSVRSLIPTTMVTSYLATAIMGSASSAMALTGTMVKPLFDKHRLQPKNLSRVMEDTATQGAAAIPWNANAIFAAAALGVAPLTFIPFLFLAFFTPVFSLLYGFTGFTMTKMTEEEIKELENEEQDA